MRFGPDFDGPEIEVAPNAAKLREALVAAVFLGLVDCGLSDEKREALTIALVLEISEALYGVTPLTTEFGDLYPVVWLAGPPDIGEARPVELYCEARLDLLFEFVGIVDARLSECELLPPASAPWIVDIVAGLAAIFEGDGAPILAFSRRADGEGSFTSAAPPSREDILALVEDYFDM